MDKSVIQLQICPVYAYIYSMIHREISERIKELREKYPVVTLTGARQTGKTTLLKALYKDLPYVNLEDVDNRTLAIEDPRGFLANFPEGAVIDEAQQAPELFSYIQQLVDEKDVHFALSGSQNFLLMENITQSLAGRTAIFNLMPFSHNELVSADYNFDSYESLVFKGGFPRLYDKSIAPGDFYPYYITTYVERDVRQIKNIGDLGAFTHFLQLCAGRIGQLLNLQSLANDVGISPNTVKSWISVLETGYVIYLHRPYYKNFNKRLVKSPKLYFYDTGLACSLLQIQNSEQLTSHYLKGGLFENFVLNEISKFYFNRGRRPPVYFWQDKTKREIDILIDRGTEVFPFEVKAAYTKNHYFLNNLKYWKKQNDVSTRELNVVYGGNEDFTSTEGNFISWRNLYDKLNSLG